MLIDKIQDLEGILEATILESSLLSNHRQRLLADFAFKRDKLKAMN
jgi:hypothetical protein